MKNMYTNMYTKRDKSSTLRSELKQYETSIADLTPDERKALHKWVTDGNSVHDNPYWLAGENGNSLCYIMAIRLVADLWSHHNDYGI